jgi:hypothetical protein
MGAGKSRTSTTNSGDTEDEHKRAPWLGLIRFRQQGASAPARPGQTTVLGPDAPLLILRMATETSSAVRYAIGRVGSSEVGLVSSRQQLKRRSAVPPPRTGGTRRLRRHVHRAGRFRPPAGRDDRRSDRSALQTAPRRGGLEGRERPAPCRGRGASDGCARPTQRRGVASRVRPARRDRCSDRLEGARRRRRRLEKPRSPDRPRLRPPAPRARRHPLGPEPGA